MKKSFVLIIIISFFFTQCYTQYQYAPDEYECNSNNEIVCITLKDSAKLVYEQPNHQFICKDDSLLIINKVNPQNKYEIFTAKVDTLNINQIAYLKLSRLDHGATIIAYILGSAAAILLIAGIYVATNGIDFNLSDTK